MSELPKNRKYKKCLKRNSCARKSQFPDTIFACKQGRTSIPGITGQTKWFFLLARIYSSIRSKHMQNYIEKQINLLIYLNRVFYPPVNVYITMENHNAINGKIHYFYGNVQ